MSDRLSVIIPFYDEVHFIAAAVRSVLSQGLVAPDIIVVNDNPARFSPEHIAALDLPDIVRVVHHCENKGLSAARNTGLDHAHGAHVAFLDADDYYLQGGLARQWDAAVETGADICHAQALRSPIGTPDARLLPRDRALFSRKMVEAGLAEMPRVQFFTSSWSSIYRRDFLDRYGLRFDEEQRKFEDRLFVLHSVTAAGRIAITGQPARVWRGRAGSISVDDTTPATRLMQLQLLEKCMAHMRACVQDRGLPAVFARREAFNTLSRLIWDVELIQVIADGNGPEASQLTQRVQQLVAGLDLDPRIHLDPVLRPISRVGKAGQKGRISHRDFWALRDMMRRGDFTAAQDRLSQVQSAARPRPLRRTIGAGKRLILHVGLHKTGSTYVQKHLWRHRDTLVRHGVLVPRTGEGFGTTRPLRPEAFPGHLGLFQAARSGEVAVFDALRSEIAQSDCETVLISCENMIFPYLQGRTQMLDQLFSLLGGFSERTVIAVLRRPDRWLDAYFREVTVSGARGGARSFGEFSQDYGGLLLNLPALFAPFEAFAGRPVRFGDFDASVAKGPNGLWHDFLTLAGLPEQIGVTCPADPEPVYPSVTREDVTAAQMINALEPVTQRRLDLLASYLTAPRCASPDAPLASPQDRARHLDLFADLSAGFATERGYAPDLSGWRQALETEDWSPAPGLSPEAVSALVSAGLSLPLSESARAGSNARSARNAEIVLRIGPRPWVIKALAKLGLTFSKGRLVRLST